MKLILYTDGGSLNNPGEAASAYLIYDAQTKKLLDSRGIAIGIASNNIAEYRGLIEGLSAVKKIQQSGTTSIDQVSCFADSELMVKQLNGIYKVKQPHIRELLLQIRVLEGEIQAPISYTHVLREKNREADALVKKALGR